MKVIPSHDSRFEPFDRRLIGKPRFSFRLSGWLSESIFLMEWGNGVQVRLDLWQVFNYSPAVWGPQVLIYPHSTLTRFPKKTLCTIELAFKLFVLLLFRVLVTFKVISGGVFRFKEFILFVEQITDVRCVYIVLFGSKRPPQKIDESPKSIVLFWY